MRAILVVDDNEIHRNLVIDILKMDGYTNVLTANSVEDAKQKFLSRGRKSPIGTIISDYSMSDGCGDDLHRALLRRLRRRNVKFIAMSGGLPEIGEKYFARHSVPRIDKTRLMSELPKALKRYM